MACLPPFLALMRPHQWVKNAFVAAPLFFTPEVMDRAHALPVLLAIAVFCLLSSCVYIINDWADREADRLHPEKRTRPLAAGTVSLPFAGVQLAVLAGAAAAGSLALGRGFALVALAYVSINLAYSLRLKQIAILDVLMVAAGFVLRVVAGAAVIGVVPSAWIIIMTGLLALFIALAKRRDDLVRKLADNHRAALAGYNKPFIDTALTVVLSALLVAYLIYTTEAEVIARMGSPYLYATVPWVVAGVLRYLQIIYVEERSGSPTSIALKDRFIVPVVLGWIATFTLLIYA